MLVDDQGHPRISGFEYAHISGFNSPLYSEAPSFAPEFTAPEILTLLFEDENIQVGLEAYTKESDIYAFALFCFEVSFLTYLFFKSDV